ncbi:inositol monophosphatase family protein [Thalassobaculum sp. OXR-137]|uniref:inositol monophosphatase family protein n=1 Tax=Thalassobaculum sp. OXR-137 TaxID=3100173 RepID=UPI002AC977EA|nr:inositol monophosphatase family protein [Thalassobaculum sp. OXR-137]WPZ36905.1 inositol monophosphatase family protein [Thalassobaculum sp. OXR-137]
MAVRSALYNVVFKACQKAARSLRRDFGEVENLQVSKKGPADFVSTADKQAEKVLYEELKHARPKYGFLMEESGTVEGTDPNKQRWIIDPLDGTLNFLHGIPHFAISVALEEKGEIIAGAVYQPLTDEFYWAEKGAGAYLNDRRLRVSGRRNMQESVMATGIPVTGLGGNHDTFLAQQRAVMEATAGVRRFGAAALDLAWVASGRFDGYWEHKLNPWDIAAGILLVKEAGGYVSDFAGRTEVLESGDVVAANDALHVPLLKLLRVGKSA